MRLIEIDQHQLAIFNKYKPQIKFAARRFVNRKAIYRGLNYEATGDAVVFFDPAARATPRKSANTHNYYTLWIDNSAKWSNFPKRSYSLICSTSLATAEGYGESYVIIPTVDTTIGVCPQDDFWDSFHKPLGNYQLNDFMDYVHEIFLDQQITPPSTYKDLRSALKKINLEHVWSPRYSTSLTAIFKKYGALGAFDYILDPVTNGLKLSTWKNFKFPSHREVWLSAPCVLVEFDVFQSIAHNNHPDYSLK